MKYKILSVLLICGIMTGCTSPSTKMAQNGYARSTSVLDGVHNDMMNALARETYESAVLKATSTNDKTTVVSAIKEFAKKRDMMMTWDRDHERANSYSQVTVGTYLFSQQGIINYIGSRFSDEAKKTVNAWELAETKLKAATPAPAAKTTENTTK